MPPPSSPPSAPASPSSPPRTLSTLATSLPPPTNTKYSTQARLYLSKYHALHSLSGTLLTTASDACSKYLHHGCLCFIHSDLVTCHTLITQLDSLSADTRAHAHEIGARSFIASERLERLRRRDDKLLQRRNEMAWELIARECQVDAQVRRWNGIIRTALQTRSLPTSSRVGLMMCHSRLGLAEQAVRKQEGRNERMRQRLVRSWENVDEARRVAGFLNEYDDVLQSLQGVVDVVAGRIEGEMQGLVEKGREVWRRKGGEHEAFRRGAGDSLECPRCLCERWSGPMEFGERVGWFRDEGIVVEERGEGARGRGRASSV